MDYTEKIRATAMTRDRLPTTRYNMYNKVEFLAAWKQVVEFYGCQDNFKTAEMPEGYDLEAWRRGHSTAIVLLQTHLEEAVYENIIETSQDTPYEMWKVLQEMFLAKHDDEALSNAQSALLQCKQGPTDSILEHSGRFNKIVRLLHDLDDTHVKDDKYVYTIFKQSLNITYAEVFRPVEVTKGCMTYKEARQELLRLELAGKVYATMSTPSANVAMSKQQLQRFAGLQNK